MKKGRLTTLGSALYGKRLYFLAKTYVDALLSRKCKEILSFSPKR